MSSFKKLKGKKDFNRVYRRGRSVSGNYMYFKFVGNVLNYSRFKVVVSKKISKKAVIRNRNRRRIEEIVRTIYPKIKEGYDGVFFLLKNTNEVNFKDLELEIVKLFIKSGLING